MNKYIYNQILLSGNSLPLPLLDTSVVPYGESFLLVGGCHAGDNLREVTDTIYKYEVLSESWTLLDTREEIQTSISDCVSDCVSDRVPDLPGRQGRGRRDLPHTVEALGRGTRSEVECWISICSVVGEVSRM